MGNTSLEAKIGGLQRIRDILLQSGIRSDLQDANLQKICNAIDAAYEDLMCNKTKIKEPAEITLKNVAYTEN